MGYTALYRKFRPTKFKEIVGQEHITKTIKNQIIAGKVGHAYLFTGGRGTGKTSAAKILARVVNCLNPQKGEPCNKCEMCKASLDESLTDIIEMDAASNNSVDDIREIRETVNFLPARAKYRVYIIDEVHMLSTGAFNALLKTLEEPPAHVKFILATTEPQKIPATILSRCQRFDFKRISNENIIKRLKIVCNESKIEISNDALNLIATLAEGGMRDALSILERCNQDGEDKIDETKIRDLVGIPKITYIKQIVEGIISKDIDLTLSIIEKFVNEGKDLNNTVWEIMKYVKDILLFKSTQKTETYTKEEIVDIKNLSEKLSKEELINLIYALSELENNMKISSQKLIIFQTGLIKLCNNSTGREEMPKTKAKTKVTTISKKEANPKSEFKEKLEENKKDKAEPDKKEKTKEKMQDITQKQPKEYWPKLVEGLKKDGKIIMNMYLAGTIAKEANDMTLEIEFPKGLNNAIKTFLEQPENKQNLKNRIQLETGKEMQLKFIDTKAKAEQANADQLEQFMKNKGVPFNII